MKKIDKMEAWDPCFKLRMRVLTKELCKNGEEAGLIAFYTS